MRSIRQLTVADIRDMSYDAETWLEEERYECYDEHDDYSIEHQNIDAMQGETVEPGDMAAEDDSNRKCTFISTVDHLAVIASDDGAFISCPDAEMNITWIHWTLIQHRWPPKLSCCMS